ncbi:cation-independent mannose-6-phosphate receptor-like [Glandiceps talaboti]
MYNMAEFRKPAELSRVYFLKLLIVLTFLTLHVESNDLVNCKVGDYDLSPLQPWTWNVFPPGDKNTVYHIGVCKTFISEVYDGCQGSTVCKEDVNGFSNIGNAEEVTFTQEEDSTKGGFRLDFKGPTCDLPGIHEEFTTTTISFRCGKTLGSPEFIEASGCTYYFEWFTTAACKLLSRPAKQEVKCYVYDEYHNKRDLTPLIKTAGGYFVDSEDDGDFYINVCRDITPETDGATKNCAEGSAACLVDTSTDKANTMGVPSTASALKLVNNKTLTLHYEAPSNSSLGECNGQKPQVTISFVCPQDENLRGGGSDPRMLSSINCQYEIEWNTEYACKTEYVVAKGDVCGFTQDNHGIDIDLSPLTKDPNALEKYTAEGIGSDDKDYVYYINVCGTVHMDCNGDGQEDNDNDIAICQTLSEGTWGTPIGKNSGRILRYSDGELVLIYQHGSVCNHNDFQRTSIITFVCNQTAGIGSPRFVTEDDCSYFFEWHTQHACPDHSRDSQCRVTSNNGKRRYDLSQLVRTEGTNWEAVDERAEDEQNDNGRYFLNVCGDVLSSDPSTPNCPAGSAGCVTGTSDVKSLGKYHDSPVIDGNNLKLTYTEGSICHDSIKITTVITFICSPGNLESGPSLIRIAEGGCVYEFEWRTAAACPLSKKTGDDCKIVDEDAGLSFDLSKLSSSTLTVTSGHYEFYINVCQPVTGIDGCDVNAAACQKDIDSGTVWKLGEPSDELEYYDGVIRLVYDNGDPYRGDSHINRKTEIAFLCKEDADPGQPEYVDEGDHAYLFKWYTKYACPLMPVECIVTDPGTHQQYDLSSLGKAEDDVNWSIIDDSDPNNKKKYYINVCRAINPVTDCDPYAATCQKTFSAVTQQEVAGISNLGSATTGPVIDSPGNLVIEYTGGSPCTDTDGNPKETKTTIHFICEKGSLSSSPHFLEKIGNCEYSFMWNTDAACPIEDTEGNDCVVKDPNSEYVFNLQPLRKKNGTYYSVQSEGPNPSTFKINICGGVIGAGPECPAIHGENLLTSACVVNGNQGTVIGRVNTELEYSNGPLTLKYAGLRTSDGSLTGVEITFRCKHDITLGEPKFVRTEDNTYFFEFETALACSPEAVDCLVSDMHGNQYDLSPLARDTGNWEAVDTRDGYGHLRYHINVCKQLNVADNEDYTCPGGAIGACQTDSGDATKNFNLGYVQAMPEAGIDGSVSIRYLNGDKCHQSKYYRSTRINFECSTTQGAPIFQTETPECEYVFVWETPSACPLEQQVGSNCKVQDPRFGYEFDILPLRNKSSDYRIQDDKYTYLINVCGPLVGGTGECSGTQGVGSCQTQDDGSVVNAGMSNQNLRFEDGLLVLNYTTGKKCHNDKYERATLFQFTCDHSATGSGSITFLRETDDCTYTFMWHTIYACPPYDDVECSYRDENGKQYDLTPLAKLSENYMVIPTTSPSHTKEIYYINVCRSLLQKPGLACPYNSASCLVSEENGKNNSLNLGTISSGPYMENGHLMLQYTDGQDCPGGGKKRKTFINFECNIDAVGSLPQFSYASENCEFYFLWVTNAACEVNGQKETVSGDCKATNPETGFQFDLNALRKDDDDYQVNDGKGHQFLINACGPVKSTECEGDKVGSCQVELGSVNGRNFNAGNFNKSIRFEDGILSTNYMGGDPCHNGQFNRNTIIEFVCDQDKDWTDLGSPVFISESDECTYYFSWHTPLVCEKQLECAIVKNDGDKEYRIDLSALIDERGHYLAVSEIGDSLASYYINLCRPLNPIPNSHCPAGASACSVKPGFPPMSLGRLDQEPYIDGNGDVVLKYIRGSACPEEASRNLSTIITFHCEPGLSEGVPKVIGYSDCTYLIDWRTNAVCSPSTPAPATVGCTYRDSALQYTFNLSSLTAHDADHVYKVQYGSSEFQINVCGAIPGGQGGCQDAGVCLHTSSQVDKSLGSSGHQEFMYDEEVLKLVYTGGDTCPGSSEKTRTTIQFECDETVGLGSPRMFSIEGDCAYVFQWKTNLACALSSEPCVTSYNGKTYDLKVLSQQTGDWKISDEFNNEYYINLCVPVSHSNCPPGSSVCRHKPDGTFDSLGNIETQAIKVEEDGEVVKLMVQYSEGSDVCKSGRRSEMPAQSVIEFQCAKTVGGPVVTRIPQNEETGSCQFYFEWKSHVACSTERDSVEISHNKITDPITGGIIDLSPLMENEYTVKGDVRLSSNFDQYNYKITLNPKGLDDTGDCSGAAVCQTKEGDSSFHRNVGLASHTAYFMEADELEMVITNPGSCHKEGIDDVESTIIFHCSQEQATPGKPEFFYESKNCQYFFHWYTPAVCLKSVNVVYPKEQDLGPGGRLSATIHDNPGTVAIVTGVVILAITICILLIVFHKPERRASFAGKVKRCCCPGYSNVPVYKYSQLTGNDEESDLLMNTTEREYDDESEDELGAPIEIIASEPDPPAARSKDKKGKEVKVEGKEKEKEKKEKDKKKKKSKSKKEDEKMLDIHVRTSKNGPFAGKSLAYHDDSDEDMLNI